MRKLLESCGRTFGFQLKEKGSIPFSSRVLGVCLLSDLDDLWYTGDYVVKFGALGSLANWCFYKCDGPVSHF